MLLYTAVLFFVSSTAAFRVGAGQYKSQSAPLELVFADRYMVKATRWSLTSGVVEDYVAWKTNVSSRVDYNNGASRLITKLPEVQTEGALNHKYEIRYVSTETELNKLVCTVKQGNDEEIQLEEILPYNTAESKFQPLGNETIDGLETVKFEMIIKTDEEKKLKEIVWAYYDNMGLGEEGWIPVKYDLKEYDLALGALTKHEIWEFSGFDQDFDDPFVFDVEVCPEDKQHTWDSEVVTKNLTFVDPENEKHVDRVFNSFKTKYSREYAHEFEHLMRRMIFKKNMRLVRSVNRKGLGFTLAINQFSDRTPQEIERSRGLVLPSTDRKGVTAFPYNEKMIAEIVDDLPENYDARMEGLVTSVKNQETCGSCWTFAATAVVEGALSRAMGGKLISLSNQALIDCAYDELIKKNDGGCNGGFDYAAYDWIIKHGVPTVEEYGPYKNSEDFCHIANVTKTYRIRGYTDVTSFSNNATKVAMFNHGPLFIYINSNEMFEQYSGGIFYLREKDCSSSDLNHAVVMVGYGVRHGEPYWILKNSWGPNWGEDGFMLISARDSVCGVTSHVSYPVL